MCRDYKFNDIYIPAGLQVIIPVYFLHSDHALVSGPTQKNLIPRDSIPKPAKDTRHSYQV